MRDVSDASFEHDVLQAEGPVVVDFWAPWCGPCRVMHPHFEDAARQLRGRAVLARVNSDDNPRTSARFGIRSIPTLVKLDHGREVTRQSGAIQSAQIVQFANTRRESQS